MQENICGQVKLRIYDVQDAQRLSPQHSFKRKVSNQPTAIFIIYRIKYFCATCIYVPANLIKDTKEIRVCYFKKWYPSEERQ